VNAQTLSGDGLPPGTRRQKYELLEQIGAGGWGIVYKARSDEGQLVAVKEFYPQSIVRRSSDGMSANAAIIEAYDKALEQFREEAKTLRGLHHPSVVGIRDYFEEEKTGFLVMDFVEGAKPGEPAPSLAKLLPDGVRKKPNEVIELARQLLDALAFLHSRRVVHRDIAPDNVLMTGLRNEIPVIVDMGGARTVAAGMSHSIETLVKPGYTPLEQYSYNAEPQPSVDVYATAALLYRLVTGTTPLEAVKRASNRKLKLAPLDVATHSGYPAEFLAGIELGLALNPEDRPQSIDDWRADLFRNGGRRNVHEEQSHDRQPSNLALWFVIAAALALAAGYWLGAA
jgi:serine/threonine protein kinase